MAESSGRTGQRRRTRDAILDGARALLSRGETVTVAAAAAEHGISRATAYRYFSDANALTLEAGLAPLVPPYEEVVTGTGDLRGRLRAIVAAMIRLTIGNEAAFRQYLSHAVIAPEDARSRGARRVAYMRRALEEMPHRLDRTQKTELVAALSIVAGVEGVVALADVAQTAPDETSRLLMEVAEAILDRFLGPEAGQR